MNQTPLKPSHDEVRLAIWPCAQQTDQQQRHGRYLPGSARPPATILPELARRAIESYSRRGDLVLDPICGTGTTLVEAVHLGRRAIGVEPDGRQAALARANLQNAKTPGATDSGQAICGDPDDVVRVLAHHARHLLRTPKATDVVTVLPYGRVDLLLTLPDTRGPEAPKARYGVWVRLLRPGAFLVLVIDHPARDRLSETVSACETIGLRFWQHVIALRAVTRDDELPLERPTTCGDAAELPHQDVLVFRKQQSPHDPPNRYRCRPGVRVRGIAVQQAEAIKPLLESESV